MVNSQSNFIFAAPPDKDGEKLYQRLKEQGILVRYFPGEITGQYIRITIGTKSEIEKLLILL